MKFEEKLKKKRSEDIWNEYCGFLDLTIDEYMNIQNRLMEEQLFLWENCGLGKASERKTPSFHKRAAGSVSSYYI